MQSNHDNTHNHDNHKTVMLMQPIHTILALLQPPRRVLSKAPKGNGIGATGS